MKKKILFVTSSIGMGGNEKVLLNILKVLDRQKYELSLLVLDGVINDNILPDIKVENLGKKYNIVSLGFKAGVVAALKTGNLKLLYGFIKEKLYYYKSKKKNYYIDFWNAHKSVVEVLDKQFDVAVAFGLGIQVLVTIDKINALQKIAWVNNDCSLCLETKEINFLKSYYNTFDKIVTVTPAAQQGYEKAFGALNKPTVIIKDLFDEEEILNKATLKANPFEAEERTVLVTVGRVSKEKGYFLLLEAAKILKSAGKDFVWKIIGNGDTTAYLKKAAELDVTDVVEFCGVKANPYPYIKHCDIYVQTSLWEGNCLTLIEAMLLERPIVSTNFPSAIEKITDNENGFICEMEPEKLAEKINLLMDNNLLKEKFISSLKSKRISNTDEIAKIDSLLNGE